LIQSQKIRSLLDQSDEVPDKTTYIFTWLNEFEVYYERREYEMLRTTLVEFKKITNVNYPIDTSETVQILFYEAVVLLTDKKLQAALNHFETVLENAEFDKELKLKVLEKSYQALTVHYYFNEAIPIAQKALELASEFGEYGYLDILVDTAQIYESANNFQKAIELLTPIETRVLSLEDEELAQRYYSLLTKSAEQLPDARTFERARHQWFNISQNLSNQNAFYFCIGYARILINLNQTEKALELLDRADELAVKLKWDHHLTEIVIEKAICESRLNRYEESHRRLTEISPPSDSLHLYATYLNTLADCQSELNLQKEAKANYQKSIALIEEHSFLFHYASAAYSNMGLIEHNNKNYTEAEKLYLKGLKYDVKGGITQQQITAHYNLGVLYIDWMRMKEAENHLWLALRLVGETYGESKSAFDQKSISDEWFTIIELLIELLLERGEEKKALRLLLNKNSIFSDLSFNKLDQLPLPLLLPEQQLIAYSGIRRDKMFIFHLTCPGNDRLLRLMTRKIVFSVDAESEMPQDLKDAVDTFRKNSLKNLGERDKDYRSSYPWMIRYLHSLCSKPKRLQTPKKIALLTKLFDIFSKILIAPLGDISNTQNLIISPDYILGALPFSALFTDEKNEKRLIENFNISIFGGFINATINNVQAENVVIFGATEYSHKMQLTDLPAGILEAKNIQHFFPKTTNLINKESEIILDEIILEIEKNNSKYLHFIGHAADSYPESVLYYPYVSGGIIPLSAIRKLPLSGKTVYVSACSSANGQAYAGWGIDSVARSFLDAGTETVISLLFPLLDELSPFFVSEIYNRLKLGNSPESSISTVQKLCLSGRFGYQYQSVLNWSNLLCIRCFPAM
jgi:tetratricopeptide (TPR) repeat protein